MPGIQKYILVPEKARRRLSAKSVQCSALSLESIDHVERGNRLSLGVFGVRDRISDDRLQERLQNTSCLLVDHGRDTLDTTSTSETSDGGLGDTLNVVSKNLYPSQSVLVRRR